MKNRGREILEIVTYAKSGEKHGNFSALAGYTKNLLDNMTLATREKIVVFSNIKGERNQFIDNGVLVDECWRRTNSFFWQIISRLRQYPSVKIIHLQHEFNLFGGPVSIPLSLWLIFWLKIICRKKILITFHGVISQKIIDDNFVKINSIPLGPRLVAFSFRFYYRVASFFVDQVIVHADKFKNILEAEYGYRQKIAVIPIGVEKHQQIVSREDARKKLEIQNPKRVLLYFGFLAGYKGLDLLLDAFELLDDRYQLFIAGGKPARAEGTVSYDLWYESFAKRCRKDKRITLTGFLASEDVGTYFLGCDLAIFPYLLPLSSSAALATAISYSTSSIVSDAFSDMVDEEIIFKTNPKALKDKIEHFFNDPSEQNQKIIDKMRKEFTWKNSSNITEILFESLLLKEKV